MSLYSLRRLNRPRRRSLLGPRRFFLLLLDRLALLRENCCWPGLARWRFFGDVMLIETIILPALAPVIADGLRGLFARLTQGRGAQPQSVAEQIQLMQAHTERVRAMAELDSLSPNASPWVADMRGAFRYVAVGGILITTLIAALAKVDAQSLAVLIDLSGASMSFIIGERMYLGLKK